MANIKRMGVSDVKLFVRVVDTPYGKMAALVDEKGLIIDGQASVETSNGVDEITRAKVVFNIDWWDEK